MVRTFLCDNIYFLYLKSLEIIQKVKNELLNYNYQVTLVLGNSPDHDVMMAYNAKYIASSGGGYGRVLIEVAISNGATHINTSYQYFLSSFHNNHKIIRSCICFQESVFFLYVHDSLPSFRHI
tara:strand:+ start:7374 stop:7742 length:369 start_codon:yes stop_codon:yes gene_type:complete